MSTILFEITVGGCHMELRESRSCHGKRYTSVFRVTSQPDAVALVYLGNDRAAAWHIFARKVECHRTLVGDAWEGT